jgi:demethylmenaquinone methyltransferase / 2-methoxy-6-polyprenyl-1,4-benzoquinol methylase
MTVRVQADDVRSMFGRIAGRYDVANTILSGGVHYGWRRALVRSVPSSSVVLDVATGTGGVLSPLVRRCQKAVGVDFCLPMLMVGAERGIKNLVCGDGLQLPFGDGVFDDVTIAFGVRNFEQPARGLEEMRRVLKPGGRVHVLEFGQPTGTVFRRIYEGYSSWFLPLLGSIVTGERAAYEYLPETSRLFPCGESFCQLLREAGFENTSSRSLTGGIAYLYGGVVPCS